ncbi:MAG: 4Fe-4S binding protein [Deltaproteobacteria bacterium]|nr:4Fe-4S binding protein [Deltaproteobacteria bacterium]
MRYLWLRRVYQATFLALFLFLVGVTTISFISGYPVEWFLGFDPLVAIATALAGHTLFVTLAWSLPLIVLTLVMGRFFCGWICPMGTLHHFFGWVGKLRRVPDRVKLNAPRPAYTLKYYLLVGFLVAAVCGSAQIGLLDPIAFIWRAFTTVVMPAADNTAYGVYQGTRHFSFGGVIAILFIAALAMNLWIPRLYCRLLCPLGALLGLLSRFALFRLQKDPDKCKDCNACGADCQGAAEPHGTLRVSECMLCLNCQGRCPRDGIRYGFLPSPELTTDRLDLTRRRTLTAALGGLLAVPLLRAGSGSEPRPSPLRIRPPGALDEPDFLARCIKCGVCMKACPTGGLQPTLTEAGLEGLWTPILVPRLGYCENLCVLCSAVCPTGAIAPLTVLKKVGKPPHQEPVRIGSAFIDRGRCLPWAMDTACIVCEEVCPTSPKAVYFKLETVVTRDGSSKTLKRPFVDLDRCVGCGVCENHCPVYDEAAIRVTSVGESRSAKNRIMLTGGRV